LLVASVVVVPYDGEAMLFVVVPMLFVVPVPIVALLLDIPDAVELPVVVVGVVLYVAFVVVVDDEFVVVWAVARPAPSRQTASRET
jgi:hypothetical protein